MSDSTETELVSPTYAYDYRGLKVRKDSLNRKTEAKDSEANLAEKPPSELCARYTNLQHVNGSV